MYFFSQHLPLLDHSLTLFFVCLPHVYPSLGILSVSLNYSGTFFFFDVVLNRLLVRTEAKKKKMEIEPND